MSNEFNIKLNPYKLKFLFQNLIKVKCMKSSMSRRLGFQVTTLESYLTQGHEYCEKFEEILEPVMYIDTSTMDEDFNLRRDEYRNEFMETSGLSNIGDKYRNTFESHFYWMKEYKKEEYIYKLQKEFVDNYKFSDSADENKKIRLLILFRKIWERASIALEDFLYSNVDKALPSTKHVNVNMKFIEKLSPEDWVEQPKQLEVKGSVSHNMNFAQISNMIAEQRPLQNKEEIIDVEFESQ